MAYCTLDDILKLIPQAELILLTDDAGSGSVDSAVVSETTERSDRLIDAMLATRYLVPFSPVPAVVADISSVLAAYELQARRPQTMPEEWRKRRDDSMALLKLLASGGALLAGAIAAGGQATAVPAPSFSGPSRLFDRTSLEGC